MDKLKPLTKTKTKTRLKLKEPEEFKVILLNDHYTTMNFVEEILMKIFQKNPTDARHIMLSVHHKGKGLAGVYPRDIAYTKAEQVRTAARVKEFPLSCIVE